VHLYRFALLEHADEKERDQILSALKPPVRAKIGGVPAWYGSDDDAWQNFAKQARSGKG